MNTENISLYERVGGEEGIDRLVNIFYARVLADKNLADFFSNTSIDRLKKMQKEFFSVALGGPIEYSDMDLSRAHQGKGIRVKHFRGFVDHLIKTLSEFDLSEDEINQIISEINTYVTDIADDSEAPLA